MADSEEATLESPALSAAPISFSFSRTTSRKRLTDSANGSAAAPEEKDFLKSVEGRELLSVKPSEAPKELLIPLIQNAPRRRPPAVQTREPASGEPVVDEVLSQAVKELIEESKKAQEGETAGGDPTLSIPMTHKACTPKEEAPDEPQSEAVPEEANYEAVPVEAYGLALLRGMGWKPGEGVGRTFNQVVQPRVNALRPKGLGLGASLAELQSLAATGPHGAKPNEERSKDKEDQPKELVPGGAALILSGPHRGQYGKVEGLDPDNARAMIRLALGNRMVTVSEYCLQPVSQQEYDKNSNPDQVGKTCPRQQNTSGSREVHRREDSSRKHKHLPDQGGPPTKVNTSSKASRTQHWLHRDLRVRFVDKQHKGGQYYNTKMTIEDVLSPYTCVCRTDEGRYLEGLRENQLETLVPKVEGQKVMVVLGPQAGKVGRLLGRNQARSRAMVQLQRENQLLELHYDAVCEYVGPGGFEDD